MSSPNSLRDLHKSYYGCDIHGTEKEKEFYRKRNETNAKKADKYDGLQKKKKYNSDNDEKLLAQFNDRRRESIVEDAEKRRTELLLEEMLLENATLKERIKIAEQKVKPDNVKDPLSCDVCMDAKKDTVLEPCGHLCVCSICAKVLDKCPVCRTEKIATRKIFIS